MLNAALQKRDQVSQLSALEDELRLRLSAQAAGAACFDWNVSDGIITWDGATDILPVHLDARDACNFLDNIAPERRAALLAVLDSRGAAATTFEVDVEFASAMGAVGFTLAGTRMGG